MLMQNFGGQLWCIMGDVQVASAYNITKFYKKVPISLVKTVVCSLRSRESIPKDWEEKTSPQSFAFLFFSFFVLAIRETSADYLRA